MSVSRLASLLFGVVGARLAAAVIGLATQVLLARALGAELFGGYLLAASLAGAAGLAISAGYPAMGTTSLARFLALGRSQLFAVYLAAARRDMAVLTVAAAVGAVLFVWLYHPEPAVRLAVIAGCLTAPILAVIRMNSVIANAQRRFALSFLPDFVVRSAFYLACIAGWFWISGGLSLVFVLYALPVTALITAALQAWLVGTTGYLAVSAPAATGRRLGAWRTRALAMLLAAGYTTALGDIVTLIAGFLLPPPEVAVIGIAVRLAALAGFVTQMSQQAVIRDLAAAMTSGSREQERRMLLTANVMSVGTIVTAIAVAAVAGDRVLSIFGPHYVAGQWLLVLLLVAQGIRAAGGMNLYLLSMQGRQIEVSALCVLAFAVLLGAAVLLTPWLGSAAIAWAVILAEAVWAVGLASAMRAGTGQRGDLIAVALARG